MVSASSRSSRECSGLKQRVSARFLLSLSVKSASDPSHRRAAGSSWWRRNRFASSHIPSIINDNSISLPTSIVCSCETPRVATYSLPVLPVLGRSRGRGRPVLFVFQRAVGLHEVAPNEVLDSLVHLEKVLRREERTAKKGVLRVGVLRVGQLLGLLGFPGVNFTLEHERFVAPPESDEAPRQIPLSVEDAFFAVRIVRPIALAQSQPRLEHRKRLCTSPN
mmetsp:Transcript_30676/g.91975  ORF Transcript_30676/g.91975 Transcript_30676/m.91975 type:complete len:221 (-) Transcript_30676:223-885(-)